MEFNLKSNGTKKSVITLAIIGLAMSCLALTTSVSAQSTPPTAPQEKVKTDFSDSQLKTFVNVNKKLQPLQQSSQEEMQKSITSAGLTVDRFNEIAKAQEQGGKSDATADESTAFNNAVKELMKQREKIDTQMQSIIKNEGMDVQTFQGIVAAYQQSPEIQQKIQKMLGGPEQAQQDSSKNK